MATKRISKKKPALPVIAYKGFDKDLKCRGYQFEVGKTFLHDGEVKACNSGFHACEYPLDVLQYYAAANSRFAVVEADGEISRHGDDSKIASQSLTLKAEIDLPFLIKAAIEYTISRTKPAKSVFNKKKNGASTNSGDYGASTNSGIRGASTNSGIRGASTNSGDYGASTNSGYGGASTNSGYGGVAAEFNGTGKAKSAVGGAIVCINRNSDGSIRHIRASKVGENGIKADVFYTLNANGEFVEAP